MPRINYVTAVNVNIDVSSDKLILMFICTLYSYFDGVMRVPDYEVLRSPVWSPVKADIQVLFYFMYSRMFCEIGLTTGFMVKGKLGKETGVAIQL